MRKACRGVTKLSWITKHDGMSPSNCLMLLKQKGFQGNKFIHSSVLKLLQYVGSLNPPKKPKTIDHGLI